MIDQSSFLIRAKAIYTVVYGTPGLPEHIKMLQALAVEMRELGFPPSSISLVFRTAMTEVNRELKDNG